MLYTFTHYASLYELYIGLLRGTISVAVALSLLISADRLLKVVHYVRLLVREWLTGHRPEHNFKARHMPDPHREPSKFPWVAVQLPMFNEKSGASHQCPRVCLHALASFHQGAVPN